MEKSERAKQFDKMLDDGVTVDRALAEDLTTDYPYFLPAVIVRLRGENLSAEERKDLLAAAATMIGNRADLYSITGERAAEMQHFDNEENSGEEKSTMDTISHFLDTFGNDDAAERKAIEQTIFNPVPDYAQLLAREEKQSAPADEESGNEQDRLISRFINRSRADGGHFPPTNEPEVDDSIPAEAAAAPSPVAPEDEEQSMLSESLAKIYIRQHKFSKALEIIQSLSLNYSEKSIYFADQMRFLEKLIENEKYKTKK